MITLVYCDDWVGMYVDGELKIQDHSLRDSDVVYHATGKRPVEIEVDYDTMEEIGSHFPPRLRELTERLV